MQVTVAIATWNRANLLDVTLSSLANVQIPAGVRWRVVVANNNSTDDTEAVLDRHADRLPLQRLFIKTQGKSHAINAIVEGLEGDLVLWTDDDVLFDEHWIAAYVDAARAWPDAAFFGGRIVPLFLEEEPPWLRPTWSQIASVFAERELGDAPHAFDESELPYGANMAMRVAFQKRYRYDPKLGRKGELMCSEEETTLMRQAIADGHRGMWVPQSLVHHLITPDRVTIDAIRRTFYGVGISNMLRYEQWPRVKRYWHGTRLIFNVYLQCLRGLPHSSATSPCHWMKYLRRVSYDVGRLEALWHDVPEWLKPPIVRRLKKMLNQPRYTQPIAMEAVEAVLRQASPLPAAPQDTASRAA